MSSFAEYGSFRYTTLRVLGFWMQVAAVLSSSYTRFPKRYHVKDLGVHLSGLHALFLFFGETQRCSPGVALGLDGWQAGGRLA
jgi:hypothetical protein